MLEWMVFSPFISFRLFKRSNHSFIICWRWNEQCESNLHFDQLEINAWDERTGGCDEMKYGRLDKHKQQQQKRGWSDYNNNNNSARSRRNSRGDNNSNETAKLDANKKTIQWRIPMESTNRSVRSAFSIIRIHFNLLRICRGIQIHRQTIKCLKTLKFYCLRLLQNLKSDEQRENMLHTFATMVVKLLFGVNTCLFCAFI